MPCPNQIFIIVNIFCQLFVRGVIGGNKQVTLYNYWVKKMLFLQSMWHICQK